MNEAQVRDLAWLARIQLTDDEVARYAGEFQAILEYVKQLDQVAGGAPAAGAPQQSFAVGFREDVVTSSDSRDTIIAQFPDRDGESLRVPKVLHYEE